MSWHGVLWLTGWLKYKTLLTHVAGTLVSKQAHAWAYKCQPRGGESGVFHKWALYPWGCILQIRSLLCPETQECLR